MKRSEEVRPKPGRIEAVDAYSTNDIALAAYLLALGYKPTLEFRFCGAELPTDEIYTFDTETALVEPKKYESAQRKLQHALDALEDEGHE